MAIKITPSTVTAAAATEAKGGRNKDPNRAVLTAEDQLRNLLARAEAAFVNSTFNSTKSLQSLNKAVERVTKQFALLERTRQVTPSARNSTLDPELQRRVTGIAGRAIIARSLMASERAAEEKEKRLDQLSQNFQKEKERRANRIEKLREEQSKRLDRWARQDQQNFKMGKAGKIQSMGPTSMAPLPTGAADKYINIATEKALALRRANYLGGGVIGGGGAGGRGGGGGWWSSNNLPVPAQYPNLPSDRGYAGVPQRQTGEVGQYTGQMIYPRIKWGGATMGGTGGGGGGGFPWGKFAAEALGGPAAVIIGALEAGKELLTMSQTLAHQMKPTLDPYNALYKAAMMTGGTAGGLQNLFTKNHGGLGSSDLLARWGYPDLEAASAAYGAYGGSYRPMATFSMATQLSQSPNTAFMSGEDWNRQMGRATGLGMGLSGGGSVEQTKKIWTDTIAAGVEKGMPPEEMWNSMQKVLNSMLSAGMAYNPNTLKMVSDVTTAGAGSAVPGMRTGSAQAQAIQAWSEASKNPMGGTGLYGTSLLSEAKRLEGTTDLSSKQWQDLIKKEGSSYKIDPESAAAIDALRSTGKFKGAMGTMLVQKFLANRGLPWDVMENMYFNSATGQLKTGDPKADRLLAVAIGAAPGSEMKEFNSGVLGTPRTSTGFTVMSAHGRRTPFTTTTPDAMKLGAPPPELARGSEVGEARAVDASATAAKLAVANFELDTLGGVTDHLNRSFSNLFNIIDKWVGGSPSGKPAGPSA